MYSLKKKHRNRTSITRASSGIAKELARNLASNDGHWAVGGNALKLGDVKKLMPNN